jgi:hypothetical protein
MVNVQQKQRKTPKTVAHSKKNATYQYLFAFGYFFA